jgi:uncharacterized protein (TIGR03086 family)
MDIDGLRQAIDTTRGVLRDVRADQLDAPTSCASWKVSDVINHVVGGQYFFSSAMRGEAPAGEAPDFAAGDFVTMFDEGAAACIAAFESEGAMERIVKLPFGEMPGSAFLGIAATDTLTHGWDVARATGQSTDLSPELATRVLAEIRPAISDGFRGEDGKAPFGPEQTAPPDASNADRLAAFLGRRV